MLVPPATERQQVYMYISVCEVVSCVWGYIHVYVICVIVGCCV